MLKYLNNPSIIYPFAGTNLTANQTKVAKAVKNCRICLVLRAENCVSVTLISTLNNTLLFKVTEQDYDPYFIRYSNNSFISDLDNISQENSFIQFNQIPVSASNLNLQLLPQCILYISSGVTFKLISRQVHTKAQKCSSVIYQDSDSYLMLKSGYNCNVSFLDDKLYITSLAQLGKGITNSYHVWNQFNQSPYVDMSDSAITKLSYGINSINGIMQEINFAVSPSLYQISSIQTVDKSSRLILNISKKPLSVE